MFTFLLPILITFVSYSAEFHLALVDKELKPYVLEYHALLTKYCPNHKYRTTPFYSVELTDKFPEGFQDKIGLCSPRINGYEILVKTEYFKKLNDNDRRQLLYHELSHCLIMKQHDPDTGNYMYKALYSIPKATYIKQVIKDIKDFCKDE